MVFCSKSVYAGACNQPVELENCYDYSRRIYPTAILNPCPNECGSDSDDKIIEYNLPLCYEPNNFRIGSDLWWLRHLIGIRYGGKLSANGLCSSKVRICAGSAINWCDLGYLYLWNKR